MWISYSLWKLISRFAELIGADLYRQFPGLVGLILCSLFDVSPVHALKDKSNYARIQLKVYHSATSCCIQMQFFTFRSELWKQKEEVGLASVNNGSRPGSHCCCRERPNDPSPRIVSDVLMPSDLDVSHLWETTGFVHVLFNTFQWRSSRL